MKNNIKVAGLTIAIAVASQAYLVSPASSTPEMVPEAEQSVAPPLLDTPGERAEFEAAGAALEDLPETQLANVWADDHTDALYVGLTDESAQETVRNALEDAGVDNYELVPVTHSQAELDQIVETIYEQPGMDSISSATHDWANNRVVLTSKAPSDALRADLYELYGDKVALEEQPLVIDSQQSTATGVIPVITLDDEIAQKTTAAARRDEDNSPFYAGGRFGVRNPAGQKLAPQCTFGFSWLAGNGDARMLTAGHCYPQWVLTIGGHIGTITDYGGSDGDYTYQAGKAISSTSNQGSVGTDGDLALINTNKDANGNTISRSGAPRIWNGGWQTTSSIAVTAVDQWSANGDDVCYSGMHRGTECGANDSNGDGGYKVVDKDASYTDDGTGYTYSHVAKADKGWGKCSKPGESGAPVYRKTTAGATAMGILSGGGGGGGDYEIGQAEGAAPFQDCHIWYTEIGQAYEAFTGQVEVS